MLKAGLAYKTKNSQWYLGRKFAKLIVLFLSFLLLRLVRAVQFGATVRLIRDHVLQSVPYITVNIYRVSRNLPNTDIRNYIIDLE